MPTIHYTFCDGTKTEAEVNDEFYTEYMNLIQLEKRNHWRETRRHNSLDVLIEKGIEVPSKDPDPLLSLLQKENNKSLEKIFSKLSADQRELLETIYIDGISMAEIARQQGLAHSTVKTKVGRIINKLNALL